MEGEQDAGSGDRGSGEQGTFSGITSLTRGIFGSDSDKPPEQEPSGGDEASVGQSGQGGEHGSRLSRNTPQHKEHTEEEGGLRNFSIIPLDGARRTLGLQGEEHEKFDEAELAREPSDPGRGGVELIEWIPTLPQLFLYMAATQFSITFLWFIAYCTEDTGFSHLATNEKWFQVASWVVLGVTALLFLIYMRFVKHNIPRTIVATVFTAIAFMSFFQAPLTIADSARAYSATWAFFRCIFIAIIGILYTVAYREEIVPPREHLPPKARNFVVRHRLDTVPA